MSKYLLDSNILAVLEAQDHPHHTAVKRRLSQLQDSDEVYFSVLTLYEYEYSIAESQEPLTQSLQDMKKTLLETFPFFPLTEEGATVYGKIKAGYKKQTGIDKKALKRHSVDFMLASSALVEEAIFVSGDRIFERIAEFEPRFQWENWTIP